MLSRTISVLNLNAVISGTQPSEAHCLIRFVNKIARASRAVFDDAIIQDLVLGLSSVMFNDLMSNIEWFFNLHDGDQDGLLTKDELLQLSESLLVSCFQMHEDVSHNLITASLSSDRKWEMLTLEPLAVSCLMHSNMATRC